MMIHPFKGHLHRRYVERKDPFHTHFIGYHGYLNPDEVFKKRIRRIKRFPN